MAFDSIADLLAMDGHGSYVWTSYGLAVGVAVANVLWVWRGRAAFFARERAALRRDAAQAATEHQA